MQRMFIVALALVLSACISVDLPGVVSDTVKVTKDVYKSATSDTPPSTNRPVLMHSYLGSTEQSVAEIKRLCVSEAAKKLATLTGDPSKYVVIDNEVSVWGSRAVANCRLAVEG